MLYTVVSTEAKYKSKNLIDTVIYRAMDAAAGWLHAGLSLLGLSLAGIAAAASGLALLLVGIAWRVGSGYRQRGGH
ncbi:MAG: hypothetical protein NTZ79_13450 [Proteobacteria bacterium]|nr:hypothetical protein [Pseudomonadota bacterium]